MDVDLPYRFFGLTEALSWLAQFSGQGFEDVSALTNLSKVSSIAFDAALFAISTPGDRETPARYAEAGVTWWLESLAPVRGSLDDLLARVEAGPPR